MKQVGRVIRVDDLSGQPCPRPKCKGKLICKCSKPTEDGRWMQRYYYCDSCPARPLDNKRTVPIEESARRFSSNGRT